MPIEPFEFYDRSNSPIQIRWIVYTHLAGVALTACLSLADRGLFISPTISKWIASMTFEAGSPIVGIIILIIFWGCPILMLSQLFNTAIDLKVRVIGGAAEFLVAIAHLFAILPSVQ
ncbi:hypothetical protein [Thalassoglobus polymorphus]|uniref:Uncharacterized protein n=1 Tax=Thalassoglobus polymorphus TaxID=2527994 RepID=A0A517QMF9_9PLAN|nr:hypothetical protein [Thalassoglobus polymorphus]QDT32737.1 hypothetical protein Mal48_19840 [Thalassoglobus polymorphus]